MIGGILHLFNDPLHLLSVIILGQWLKNGFALPESGQLNSNWYAQMSKFSFFPTSRSQKQSTRKYKDLGIK